MDPPAPDTLPVTHEPPHARVEHVMGTRNGVALGSAPHVPADSPTETGRRRSAVGSGGERRGRIAAFVEATPSPVPRFARGPVPMEPAAAPKYRLSFACSHAEPARER
jgi:hypothetical protein